MFLSWILLATFDYFLSLYIEFYLFGTWKYTGGVWTWAHWWKSVHRWRQFHWLRQFHRWTCVGPWIVPRLLAVDLVWPEGNYFWCSINTASGVFIAKQVQLFDFPGTLLPCFLTLSNRIRSKMLLICCNRYKNWNGSWFIYILHCGTVFRVAEWLQ